MATYLSGIIDTLSYWHREVKEPTSKPPPPHDFLAPKYKKPLPHVFYLLKRLDSLQLLNLNSKIVISFFSSSLQEPL
jgi:hypothetical protein